MMNTTTVGMTTTIIKRPVDKLLAEDTEEDTGEDTGALDGEYTGVAGAKDTGAKAGANDTLPAVQVTRSKGVADP